MGDIYTWGLFACILGSCIGIVLYSLFGRRRPFLVSVPTFVVALLALFATLTSARLLQMITMSIFVGAVFGLVRQFRGNDSTRGK